MNVLAALAHDLLDLVAPPTCVACRDRVSRASDPLCTVCEHGLLECDAPPRDVHAPWVFGGPLRDAILAAKYGDEAHLARRLGSLLGVSIPACELVVPVPLHARRLARRGFNQAVELARGHGRGEVVFGAVKRVRDTPPQVGRGRVEREENVRGAFGPGPRARRVAGRSVLVVDDVVTTGATLRAVGAVLVELGAARVELCALAHAPLESG